ncbi:nucleoside deaminase [Kytococcus sp. Marseille-QA3725]
MTQQHPENASAGHARDPLTHAIELAERSVHEGGGPFGAVLVRASDNTWVTGTNRVTATPDPTAHAEVEAIRAAAGRFGTEQLTGCVLYASCKPCPMCLAASMWARVDSVVFAATSQDAADAGFDDSTFRHEVRRASPTVLELSRQPHPAARAPFEAWLALPDRAEY